MKKRAPSLFCRKASLLLAVWMATGTICWAQDPAPDVPEPIESQSAPIEQPPAQAAEPTSQTTVHVRWADLPIWPRLETTHLTWLAILGILALTLRFDPRAWARSVDGIFLVCTALWLPLRMLPDAALAPDGQPWRTWAAALLMLVTIYWVIRGLLLVAGRAPARADASGGATTVFLVAAVALTAHALQARPLAPSARDALEGGLYAFDHRCMPYGDVPRHDSRSPLVYLAAAGWNSLSPYEALPSRMAPSDESSVGHRIEIGADTPVGYSDRSLRRLNLLLTAAVVGGLLVIGTRLHSGPMALVLVVIYLLFPGTLEGLGDPSLLIATALVTWSVAFALVPWVGGFLSAFTLVLAGLAWPWAWLAIPAQQAYFLRRGWGLIGAALGLLLGLGTIGFVVSETIRPTLPRTDGVLQAAHRTPRFSADLVENGAVLRIVAAPAPASAPYHLLKSAADWLIEQEDTTLAAAVSRTGTYRIELPPTIAPESVRFRDISAADQEAREILQAEYRYDLQRSSDQKQFIAKVRSLLDATWRVPADPHAADVSTWDAAARLVSGSSGETVDWLRRSMKILAGVAAGLLAVVILARRSVNANTLIGAVTAVLTLAYLASAQSAAANWTWILPILLAAHAASALAVAPGGAAATAVKTAPVPLPGYYGPPRGIGAPQQRP